MITRYLLVVMAVSVFGNQDLEAVCPFEACWSENPPKHSDKPAPKIKLLVWRHGSDLEVLKVTPSLEYLHVENCSSDFKIDVFPPLRALTKIEIANCSISELQKHQFENVVNLDSLTLTGNSIEILSNETFHKLSRLESLYLQNNLIQDLPEGVFNPLESLHRLNLNNNNISVLPKDTFLQNIKLKSISLSGNPMKIVSLDFPIWTYAVIVSLDLRDCVELRDLRLSIRVSNLYLQNSGVERLQFTGSIWDIDHENSNISRADLSGTYFHESFGPALCDMPSLEWLDLSHSSKPSDFPVYEINKNGKECSFPDLRYLNLSSIKLRFIPKRLPFFGPNLTSLDLSHNLLTYKFLDLLFEMDTPKGEEGNFPNLKFLYMAHNKLKKIPQSFPLFGPNLTILDLSYNLLEDVSPESLAKAHDLQSLYLEGNRLKSFDYQSVCDGLKNLIRVGLYDNKFNATFYHNMTKYLGDNGLSLFQKGNMKQNE